MIAAFLLQGIFRKFDKANQLVICLMQGLP